MNDYSFIYYYNPHKKGEGEFLYSGSEVKELFPDIKPEYIWTLVEGDNGEGILIPGWHLVNRLGYFVCENPHNFEDIEVVWWEADEDGEEEGEEEDEQ